MQDDSANNRKRENGSAPRAISIKITDFIDSGDAHIPKLEYKG